MVYGAKLEDRLRLRRGLKAVVSGGLMKVNTRQAKARWRGRESKGASVQQEEQIHQVYVLLCHQPPCKPCRLTCGQPLLLDCWSAGDGVCGQCATAGAAWHRSVHCHPGAL